MQLDGQMHRFFFCRFETYPSGGLRFEPTRTTFRGRSYRHLNRLNRRSEPPQTVGKPLFFCADLMIMGSNKPLYAHFDFYMKKDN